MQQGSCQRYATYDVEPRRASCNGFLDFWVERVLPDSWCQEHQLLEAAKTLSCISAVVEHSLAKSISCMLVSAGARQYLECKHAVCTYNVAPEAAKSSSTYSLGRSDHCLLGMHQVR